MNAGFRPQSEVSNTRRAEGDSSIRYIAVNSGFKPTPRHQSGVSSSKPTHRLHQMAFTAEAKDWKRCLHLQLHTYQNKATVTMNAQENKTSKEEQNKAPVTNPKEMEINELPAKEFRIVDRKSVV